MNEDKIWGAAFISTVIFPWTGYITSGPGGIFIGFVILVSVAAILTGFYLLLKKE